ncbi:MAG: C13 family peptidase [Hyphomonadaceae bacterium]
MRKRFALMSALAGLAALTLPVLTVPASAQQNQDPFGGLFGAWEIALPPKEAGEDLARMSDALAKLPPQRPGVADTYVLSVSLWNEPVFENEAREAANVLARRYDSAERTVVLSAGRGGGAPRTFPSFTPNNFNAALSRIGKLADPNEDLVIVFITSHGSPDGNVVAQEKNRLIGGIRAPHLRASLQQSGIRTSLLMISACFAGNYILPFSNDDTVILTAAAADKTSFGCAPQRDWTYFGDAMFNHALRGGESIMDAFDIARGIITKWENDLHAEWAAKPASQRAKEQEPQPSNPQQNAGDNALAVIAKAERYGQSINCAGHLSFALDRARTGRPLKGLADVASITSAQTAVQARAITEGLVRGRSSQDTAKAVVAVSTSALQLYPAQPSDIADLAARCMAP